MRNLYDQKVYLLMDFLRDIRGTLPFQVLGSFQTLDIHMVSTSELTGKWNDILKTLDDMNSKRYFNIA